MPANTMNPATAVTWGPFIAAAAHQYTSDPSQLNPATVTGMPAGYTLVRTIQMSDFFGSQESRAFYGLIAVGGDPKTAVVAIRGTETTMEWWDDFHWDLVPFTQVTDGGNVAQGFLDIYNTFGTMSPGQAQGSAASGTFAAQVGLPVADGLAADLDPALPVVVCGHSLGGALATLLVADLTANTPLKPQAWTFASPRAERRLRRTLRRPEHRVMADLQPSQRRPVLPDRCYGQLPACHHRVCDQLPGEGEVEPGLRPRAEHLYAHAVACHGAAGSGLQLAA